MATTAKSRRKNLISRPQDLASRSCEMLGLSHATTGMALPFLQAPYRHPCIHHLPVVPRLCQACLGLLKTRLRISKTRVTIFTVNRMCIQKQRTRERAAQPTGPARENAVILTQVPSNFKEKEYHSEPSTTTGLTHDSEDDTTLCSGKPSSVYSVLCARCIATHEFCSFLSALQ